MKAILKKNVTSEEIIALLEGEQRGSVEENRDVLRHMFLLARKHKRTSHEDDVATLVWKHHKREGDIWAHISIDDLRDIYCIEWQEFPALWANPPAHRILIPQHHYAAVMAILNGGGE